MSHSSYTYCYAASRWCDRELITDLLHTVSIQRKEYQAHDWESCETKMIKQKSRDRTTRYSGKSYTNEIKIDISFLLVGWVTAYRGLAVGGEIGTTFLLTLPALSTRLHLACGKSRISNLICMPEMGEKVGNPSKPMVWHVGAHCIPQPSQIFTPNAAAFAVHFS
jgi:hypothetical protein